MMALGTANTADRPCLTQASPIAASSGGEGSRRQRAGSARRSTAVKALLWRGKASVSPRRGLPRTDSARARKCVTLAPSGPIRPREGRTWQAGVLIESEVDTSIKRASSAHRGKRTQVAHKQVSSGQRNGGDSLEGSGRGSAGEPQLPASVRADVAAVRPREAALRRKLVVRAHGCRHHVGADVERSAWQVGRPAALRELGFDQRGIEHGEYRMKHTPS